MKRGFKCLIVSCALFSAAHAQAESPARGSVSASDIESMEACLAESVMVAEPDHCTGLISDACIADGKPVPHCLDQEEAIWAAILREHWSFRCATCGNGFSLSQETRAGLVAEQQRCTTDEIAAKRCLMIETARQAQHVFGNAE